MCMSIIFVCIFTGCFLVRYIICIKKKKKKKIQSNNIHWGISVFDSSDLFFPTVTYFTAKWLKFLINVVDVIESEKTTWDRILLGKWLSRLKQLPHQRCTRLRLSRHLTTSVANWQLMVELRVMKLCALTNKIIFWPARSSLLFFDFSNPRSYVLILHGIKQDSNNLHVSACTIELKK